MGKIAEIMIQLQDVYECYPSWELKEGVTTNDRKMQYYGKIVNKQNGKEYYIYNAGGIRSKEISQRSINLKMQQIKVMRSEILTQVNKGAFDRVIILVEDGPTMELFKNSLVSLGVKEQWIAPFNDGGVSLIKAYGKRDVNLEAVKQVYGNNYSKPDWIYADFTVENNKQTICLINNDAEKMISLKENNKVNRYNYSRQTQFVIICLEEQQNVFISEFPDVEIRTVPSSILD